MPKTFTLGKNQRLKSRKLIDQIFKEGRSFSVFPYRITYLLTPIPSVPPISANGISATPGPAEPQPIQVQAGFGASRRNFKKAVDRNRIKRLTREAYRLQAPEFKESLGGLNKTLSVFFIYVGKDLPEYDLVTQKIAVILQKLKKDLRV